MANSNLITLIQLVELLNHAIDSYNLNVEYDAGKNRIQLLNIAGQQKANIKLPWIFPPLETIEAVRLYLKKHDNLQLKYIIILIQAGYGAIGRGEDGLLLQHKLIRKYMVRKKQGKAQITYLQSKGKSKAGSRIRLAQTIQFFEEINQQINSWIQEDNPDRLMISCPPRLWGLLFQSKIQPVFKKRDNRIFKIPIDIKVPNKQELIRVNKLAQKCTVEIYDDFILNHIKNF